MQIITLAISALYCIFTLWAVRHRPRCLWLGAALVALGAFFLYWQAYAFAEAFVPRLVMSLVAALDLFLFRANTVGPVGNYFLGPGMQPHLVILYGLLLCALWTTSLAAIHLFASRLESRIRLFFSTLVERKEPVHIVVGIDSRSRALAASLKGKGKVVILDDTEPAKAGGKGKLNFFGVLKGIRVGESVPGALKLSPDTRRLDRWLAKESTHVYLLSENESQNVATALKLEKRGKASIWFAAESDVLTEQIPVSHPNLHLVDPAELAASELKREEALYPVHCVSHEKGYVTSAFHAVVLGKGSVAEAVAGYLREWGTFVGKDMEPAPQEICVCERIEDASIQRANWVGVCAENDEDAIRTALEVAKQRFMDAANSRHFVLAAKLACPSKYASSIRFAKENYGVAIVPFGATDDLWAYDNITGGETARFARAFYNGYNASSGGSLSWEERAEAIMDSDHTALWKALELKRKTSQDYSDYFHIKVKMALCGLSAPEAKQAAADIPVVYEGRHYTGKDPEIEKLLEYLAVGEHLRWEASHRAAGYRHGPAKSEDRKIHPDLVPYDELSEVAKHYDWVVVRTSLEHQMP